MSDNITKYLMTSLPPGVGDSGVGKTCLVKRFCEEKFTAKFHPTVGIDYGFKIHVIGDVDVRVHFWDMAG